MNDWKSEFLSQVLADIPTKYPARRYRDRLEGELSGHLDALAADLEAGGLSPEEARALALERMGDREKLRRSIRDEYRRREARDPFRCAGVLFMGFFITFGGYILLELIGIAVTYQLDYILQYILRVPGSIELGRSAYIFLAFPPVAAAAYLGQAFRYHRRPRHMVTLGLLLSWLGGELYFIGIRYLFERVPPAFVEMVRRELRDLLSGGPYTVWRVCLLLLCFLLGWLFGRPKKGSEAGERQRICNVLHDLGLLGGGLVLPCVVCVPAFFLCRHGLDAESGLGLWASFLSAAVLPPVWEAVYLRRALWGRGRSRLLAALGVPAVCLGVTWAMSLRRFLFEAFSPSFWAAIVRDEPGFRVFAGEGTGLFQLCLLAVCLVLLWAFEPLPGVLRRPENETRPGGIAK